MATIKLLRIPTGGGLTSRLFTQRGQGVELGTTENKSRQQQCGGFEPGTSRFQIQRPKPLDHQHAIIAAVIICRKKIDAYQKLSTSHEDVSHPLTTVFNTCIMQREAYSTYAVNCRTSKTNILRIFTVSRSGTNRGVLVSVATLMVDSTTNIDVVCFLLWLVYNNLPRPETVQI